jgi:hypothetical protein
MRFADAEYPERIGWHGGADGAVEQITAAAEQRTIELG